MTHLESDANDTCTETSRPRGAVNQVEPAQVVVAVTPLFVFATPRQETASGKDRRNLQALLSERRLTGWLWVVLCIWC